MESNESLRGVRIERRGVGYAALGPHFYVWDEDPRVLLATACALATTAAPSTPMRPRPQRSRAAGSRSRR
jgi:hypothetical protein